MAGSKIPDVLKAAKDHFSEQGRKEIDVPEWETTIFAAPLTLKERDRLLSGGAGEVRLSVMADIVIFKAEDQGGKKMFTVEHKFALMNEVDAEVVSRIASEILAGPTVEDARKN